MMRFLILMATALTLLPPIAAAGDGPQSRGIGAKAPIRDLYDEALRIVLEPGQTRVDLGADFLIAGSDSVTLDGLPLQRERDYRINILKGNLILVREPAGGEVLEAFWSRYPFAFSPVFASRFPGGMPDHPVTLPPTGRDRDGEERRSPYRLRLSGNKTVGFSVGSGRGLGIDQSLEVTMRGRIAEDLEVRAYLTDDDLPVQPQGNTEELESLDKVAVQVRSRHTQTDLGDFTTAQGWSDFTAFERELRGASVKVRGGDAEVYAGGGITKGRFATVNINGSEGVQGPYELLPARRFNGVIVLPGTETVYLDGRVLRRGAENEYVIDYTRATIVFTERVTISADSEIVVEFQSGESGYARTTLTAGADLPLAGGSVVARAFYFRESDDPDDPLGAELTPEDREVLASAGDDPASAISSGVREAEDAFDAYVLAEGDSVTPPHYVFVEEGGDYLVSFYEVGEGRGDYVTDGFTQRGVVKYRYAGEGEGDFRTGRPLTLPGKKDVFSLGLAGSTGALFLDAEGSFSARDRNILSGADDGDNAGGAVGLSGGIRDLDLAGASLTLSGEYSSLEERFAAPDRTRSPYFYRNWNLEGVDLEGTERISGLNMRLSGDDAFDLRADWKRLSRSGGIDADKAEAFARIGDMKDRGLSFSGFDSRSDGSRYRGFMRAEGVLGMWKLLPGYAYDTERYRVFRESGPDTGRYYHRNTVSVRRRDAGSLTGTVSLDMRRTDLMSPRDTVWARERESDELRFEGGWTSGRTIVDLVLSRRETRYSSTGASARSDLARVRWRDAWFGSVSSDAGYRISSGVDRQLEKAVVFVGENEGDYDENGNEVGQNRGDYMVIYLPAEDVLAVRTVELTWRLSAGRGIRGLTVPGRAGGSLWDSIRRNVSVDHFFSVIEKSRTGDLARLYTLDPGLLQRDDLTLYGKNSLRQEWNLLQDVRKLNLRFVFSREDEEDNRSEDVSIERFSREISMRFEAVPAQSVTLNFEGRTARSERDGGGGFGQNYAVDRLSGSGKVGWRPGPSMRLSLEMEIESREDEVSGAGQVSFAGAPSFDASIGSKIHVNSLYRLTWTDERTEGGKPLFFLEEGLRQDWNIFGQYRFTRHISFGLNYTGRREKDFTGEVKTVHALKMESRAYF